jgi:hypothetical protein
LGIPAATCASDAGRIVAERNPTSPHVVGSALYWVDYGVGFPSRLRRCSLADCAGSVETVTDALEGYVENYTIDATHAYVVQPGIEAYTGSVVALPLR